MDSLITAAAHALAAGDPLGALKRVALREDPPALALRGIAMAQLGDLSRARELLKRAARAFGPREAMARARCTLAECEVALASRDLDWPSKELAAARQILETHDDRHNVALARSLESRWFLLLGRLDEAQAALAALDGYDLAPPLRVTCELVVATIAMRRLETRPASQAIARARSAAGRTGIPALAAEVETMARALEIPAARLLSKGEERALVLADVESLLGSDALVVDACRHVVREDERILSLAGRPVLFALARTLAEAWPSDVSRDELVRRGFGGRRVDESHRARLRVEMGRLRKILSPVADVRATARGFVLEAKRANDVVVLARPVEEEHSTVLALLADGEAWSSSALALAMGSSQRTVQRALDTLLAAGKVQAWGHGRARRWTAPLVPPFTAPTTNAFTTMLLLPSHLPID
ncbi:Malic enzyme [Labilithrix luteola]|uniref:Malic enzyme n=1 Tax=Labilithrix luteola TaxID=1391654 RepID=A0A0K1Q4D7_9BACT|nr:helix-turn-helix domain-containing protein [Labilithrix luteola]AKV00604.1 Malic enzyme [Labilithrix luteola]